jgi:hypothetical protein
VYVDRGSHSGSWGSRPGGVDSTNDRRPPPSQRSGNRPWNLARYTWRDQPGLESLVDAVRDSWMEYVAGSGMFEIPRAEAKLADVIPLRGRGDESSE